MTKVCTKCKIDKSHSEFRKSKKGDRFGLHSWCKECQREYRRESYARNPEKYAVWNKQWNESNPDRRRELETLRDKEKQYASHRAYIVANPEKKRAYDHNYRARRIAAEGVLTKETILKVFATYGESCLSCNSTDRIEIDHVVPLTLGGSNLFGNLQPLCKSCNSAKGNRSCADYREEAQWQ